MPRPFSAWSLRLVVAVATTSPAAAQSVPARSQVESDTVRLHAAVRATPADAGARRTWARALYLLGDIGEARDALAPLLTGKPAVEDLSLGARLAYLTGDYAGADQLFERLRSLAPDDSTRSTAIRGLVLSRYQRNEFARVRGLELKGADNEEGLGSLLTFMQRFEGTPYGIEWQSADRVAHLKMTNDITVPGALPEMTVVINGHPVNFILDSGGDRLYLDEGLAEQLGIKVIARRHSRYAYTAGQTVDEPLGVADRVKLGEVTLRNVPVIVAKWKARGIKSDGVVTTQLLKQFLATVDYDKKEITLRERSGSGKRQLLASFGGKAPLELPFVMTGTHLMFAKGSLNGRTGLNLLMDSGLAMSMPLVFINETADMLGLQRTPVPNGKYWWVPVQSHGLQGLTRGPTQALGNVIVEENPYTAHGFFWDALISHQYLRHLGSWTIDFDAMKYYFPGTTGD
ncbi:MAG TPA: aspartyl protease family protein [Gemmatimonadales bacterium]|nr:aspartyl protease family protein [Gemmatimonadales bacterium]